jgi:TolB-like protein
MGQDEVGTLRTLNRYRAIIDPLIASHRGRIFTTAGDSLVADFASAVDAVECAIVVQEAIAKENAHRPAGEQMRFRIGIHVGDIMVQGDNLFGDAVNVTARLEALAEPGGICISGAVRDHIGPNLSVGFVDLCPQQVKNITQPIRAYQISGEISSTAHPVGGASLALPDKPSIAVLPFQNMSGDPEQEYFTDGMVEEIITALSRIRWLFVIARNSSFVYKDKIVDVKQVARELDVRYVLEGSVRKAGQRVRITGQLIDTTSGAHIWADRFDGALDDIFELQDQVASSVVGAIEPRLRQSEIERAARKPTESLDAYDLYLRALALRHKYTDESMRAAIALLERALAIDPNYAPAAAMIGFCRVHQRAHMVGSVSNEEAVEAVQLARQAIEAGKEDPDTLCMAAYTLAFFGSELDTAARMIERALTLNPNSAHAWTAHGFVFTFQNQPNQAIPAFLHSMRLSPIDPLSRASTIGLAAAHLVAGQYEEAVQWADRTLAEEPCHRVAMRIKAVAYVHLGRIGEARDWLRRLVQLDPGLTIVRFKESATYWPSEMLAWYADALRKAGLPEE